jgi:hypothetical protein
MSSRLSLDIISYPISFCNLIATVADMERAEGSSEEMKTFAGFEGEK